MTNPRQSDPPPESDDVTKAGRSAELNVPTESGPRIARRSATSEFETWVFDLDNTLYPASIGLVDQMNVRIRQFVADLYGVSETGARDIQRDLCRDYGTTLRGLMTTRDVDPWHYLEFEERIDYSALEPNHVLAQAIRDLPGRSFVFTNGSARYAEKVLARLGLGSCFDELFDLTAAGFQPKPHRATYDAFLASFAIGPSNAIMFDDLKRNLEVPRELGMATAWVGTNTSPDVGDDVPYRVIAEDPLALELSDITIALSALTHSPPHEF